MLLDGKHYVYHTLEATFIRDNDGKVCTIITIATTQLALILGLLYKMKKKKKVFYTSQIGSEG